MKHTKHFLPILNFSSCGVYKSIRFCFEHTDTSFTQALVENLYGTDYRTSCGCTSMHRADGGNMPFKFSSFIPRTASDLQLPTYVHLCRRHHHMHKKIVFCNAKHLNTSNHLPTGCTSDNAHQHPTSLRFDAPSSPYLQLPAASHPTSTNPIPNPRSNPIPTINITLMLHAQSHHPKAKSNATPCRVERVTCAGMALSIPTRLVSTSPGHATTNHAVRIPMRVTIVKLAISYSPSAIPMV